MPRSKRQTPRDAIISWPLRGDTIGPAERARQFAENLRAAMGDRSLRETGDITGVHFTTIGNILAGLAWPDLETIAKLESGLDTALWPTVGGA